MQVYSPKNIRNICLIGHNETGKTSLVCAFYKVTAKTDRLLAPDSGVATDFDCLEIERKYSIQTSTAAIEWQNYKINIVDTPGYHVFISEVICGLHAVDAICIVINAAKGIETQTQTLFKKAKERNIPIFFVVNKIDLCIDLETVVTELKEQFGTQVIPTELLEDGQIRSLISRDSAIKQSPYYKELVEKAVENDNELLERYLSDEEIAKEEIYRALIDAIQKKQIFPLVFTSAIELTGIEELLNAFIDYAPSPEIVSEDNHFKVIKGDSLYQLYRQNIACGQVFKTLYHSHHGYISIMRVISGTFIPNQMYINSSQEIEEKISTINVLDGADLKPIPEAQAGDIIALIRLKNTNTGATIGKKITTVCQNFPYPQPMIWFAVKAKEQQDGKKVFAALPKLMKEDPAIRFAQEFTSKETVISGTGQLHLEIAVEKLKHHYGAQMILATPQVPYFETITNQAEARYRHKKMTGGPGQFAECTIVIDPLPRGDGYQFVDKIFAGAISQSYRPAVDQGIQKTAQKGILTGNPIIDFSATLVDGKEHPVDSSELAFSIAASMAFKDACRQASIRLLEPIMQVTTLVPEDSIGEAMGAINRLRGRVCKMDTKDNLHKIDAEIPLAEVFAYSRELTPVAQGKGFFAVEFSHYQEVPLHVQEELITA